MISKVQIRFLAQDLAIGLAIGAGIGLTTGNMPVGTGGGLVIGIAINIKRRRREVS